MKPTILVTLGGYPNCISHPGHRSKPPTTDTPVELAHKRKIYAELVAVLCVLFLTTEKDETLPRVFRIERMYFNQGNKTTVALGTMEQGQYLRIGNKQKYNYLGGNMGISKKEGKYLESIQSSTIPDPGHRMSKWQSYVIGTRGH